MFMLEIETKNAAFEGDEKHREIARLLREAARRIEHGGSLGGALAGRLYDTNGNAVGSFEELGS